MGQIVDRWLTLSGNARGALWLLMSAAAFSAMNAIIKWLGVQGVHTFEIVFFRSAFGLLVVLPFALRAGRAALTMSRPGMHVLRSALGLAAMFATFHALAHLPLADAVAILFAKPLFMIVLALLFLGERLRWRRSVATAIGFGGVMIMLRPGGGTLEWAALSAVLGALLMATVMVVVKKMTASERPLTMLFWFSALSSLGALPAALWVWRTPTPAELAVMLAMGVAGSIGQYFAVRAYRVGEATAVTPMDYSQLVVAGLIGFFWFGEVPDAWTAAGAAVIAASSLYILRREARSRAP